MRSVIAAPRALISDHPLPWLLPMLALLIAFAVFPFFYNIWLSFHEFVPRKRVLEFVGVENWAKLFEDSRMWTALAALQVVMRCEIVVVVLWPCRQL